MEVMKWMAQRKPKKLYIWRGKKINESRGDTKKTENNEVKC